jgi:hypothetical protein
MLKAVPNKNAGFIILLTSIFTFFFFGEIRNLTTLCLLPLVYNGFSLSITCVLPFALFLLSEILCFNLFLSSGHSYHLSLQTACGEDKNNLFLFILL